jgi:hypothetical protein
MEIKVIVLNLSCNREHLFEGWFASSDAFEDQRRNGRLSCPVCGSSEISRRPSAPYVNTGAVAPAQAAGSPSSAPGADLANPDMASAPAVLAAARALLRRLGKESEDVGERFAEEARRIHYGESEARNIKGHATRDDVGDLIDEGIMVLPLPADENLH